MMNPSALVGVKVVEFGTMVAGPYCAKMLGDLGADVIKVEPPGGDPARAYGPFPNGKPHSEHSPLFLYANTSKRGVMLDLSVTAGLNHFKKLVQWADVLVDNHAPKVLEGHGLDWDAIHALNPRLIYTSITPYGRTGPRADAPGDELTLVQSSGLGNLLPTRSLSVDRAPVKPGGNPVGFHGGLAAATATSAALLARDKSGKGWLVDISLQEVMLAMMGPMVSTAHYHKTTWCRMPDRPPAMGRVEMKDGYVIVNALDDHHFISLRELMGSPEWCADEAWNNMAYRANNMMNIASKIDAWMLTQKKDDFHTKAAEKRIPVGPIKSADEVMNYPQYEARGYFEEVDHPDAGKHRYAGVPYKLAASPARVQRPAPRLGEHNDEILNGDALKSVRAPAAQSGAKRKGKLPLEGIRVVEFAWVWAGPYCGQLLAQLGAEVIKVESHNRLDIMRRTVVWPLADEKPTEIPANDSIPFNSVNMNKKSVTLDLGNPEGLEIAKKLLATADFTYDNMRPGALAKLGLGYDEVKKFNPNIIAASSSGRGNGGPESEYLGYAMIHHALGGNAYITGYPDDHPCHTTGDVDIMNATTLAFALMAALHHRDRTGDGQFIDYSQTEAVSSLIGEVLLGYEMTKEVPERAGNQHPQYAPHNVYPSWGLNRWIAIEVHIDAEFKSLAEVMGQPELAKNPKFTNAASRKKNESELDEIISEWSRQRDRDLVARQLLAAGVVASPSQEARDLYADRHLRERGALIRVNHPAWGDLDIVGPPWKMDGLNAEPNRAPFLGEHTDEVLKEYAGLTDDDINHLRKKGIVQ